MSGLRWFDSYAGQTTSELIAVEGDFRTDSLVLAFEQALEQKAARVGDEGLTEEERVVLAVEALEREVSSGGFGSFLINPSKAYAAVIVSALHRIGSAPVAMLTEEAIDILGIEGPITVDAIDRAMEGENGDRDARLEECDDRYYAMAEDLSGPLLSFIKGNRNRIVLRE
jgi:Domain of unknown function (DUF4375)